MIEINVFLAAHMQVFCLLLEAVALTGSVATEPVRVGGVCVCVCTFFFTWDIITI